MHSVRISEKLGKGLAALAQRTGRPERLCAEQAIARFLEDEEDYYLVTESLKNPGPTTSLEALSQRLGIDLDG